MCTASNNNSKWFLIQFCQTLILTLPKFQSKVYKKVHVHGIPTYITLNGRRIVHVKYLLQRHVDKCKTEFFTCNTCLTILLKSKPSIWHVTLHFQSAKNLYISCRSSGTTFSCDRWSEIRTEVQSDDSFFVLRYCSRPETAGGRMDRYVPERSLHRIPQKSYFFYSIPQMLYLMLYDIYCSFVDLTKF